MKYAHFERLALMVGAIAVAGTILASWHSQPVVEEIVAQLLLLVVLVGAVHWGRRGGFLTAVLAIVVYLGLRAPLFVSEGLTPDLLDLVVVRTLAYGVVGILGGEACGRIKYFLAQLEGGTNVDQDTGVYNQAYLGRILEMSLGMHARYKTPFSLVLVTLSPGLTADLKPSRQRSLLRAAANHIRNDVRLVDDVARLDDGTFVMVLPQTPKSGGEVAAGRVREGLRELLGARDESVSARVMGVPEDLTELNALRDSISGSPLAA